LPVQAEVTAFA